MADARHSGRPRSRRRENGVSSRLIASLRVFVDALTGRHRHRSGVRRHQERQEHSLLPQLKANLRVLADVLTGRHHRSGAWQRHARPRHEAWVTHRERRSWLVYQEVSVLHVCAVIGLSIGLIWVAWHIVADNAAQRSAYSAPEKALGWVSDNSTALDQIAEDELTSSKGDVVQAQRSAERALRLNPLDSRALFLLAFVAERKGDTEKAAALMHMAGSRTWRDLVTQLWLFNYESSHWRFADALPHADAVLRIDPSFKKEVFPVLGAFATNDMAFKALSDFLSTDPPWRSSFLTEWSPRLTQSSRLDELYSNLQDSKNPPKTAELKVYLDLLIKDGHFGQAYRVWQNQLPPSQRPVPGQLYNSDFEFPVDGLPFNWIMAASGSDIKIVSTGENRRALRLEFFGASVWLDVKQLMVLQPGTYKFSGMVKTEALQTARGLWWKAVCANNPNTTLGHTELVSAAVAWTKFEVDFRVPGDGCEAQWLQLELPARVASESRMEGEVWYQSLRIKPMQTLLPNSG